MSSERRSNCVVINCDGGGCHKNYEGDEGEPFGRVWAAAKDDGWVAVPMFGDDRWEHYCPECRKELGDD